MAENPRDLYAIVRLASVRFAHALWLSLAGPLGPCLGRHGNVAFLSLNCNFPQSFGSFVLLAIFAASAMGDQTTRLQAATANPPAVVSVEVLRHPVPAKIRKLLLKAIDTSESGDHESAIEQLQEVLARYPDSAPYVQNLLGVEYVKTDRVQAALSSFEQAVSLLPHDAMTHYNFGLALVCAGDYGRAAREVQRALELDPGNGKMQASLNSLLGHPRPGH